MGQAYGDISSVCNAAGRIRAEYVYDAYGNCKIKNDTTNGFARNNPFRYRGYFYDTETGFYYCQTRYYNPAWGRFISMDDVGYVDPQTVSGLNLYAYCNGDPVNFSDPTGHFVISLGAVIAGLLIGAVFSGAVEIAEQVKENGWHTNSWDWNEIGQATFVGGISGAVSALFPSNLAGAALGGGIGSVVGDFLTGWINGRSLSTMEIIQSTLKGAFIGAVTFGITSAITNEIANTIATKSSKVKSLTVQKLSSHPRNGGTRFAEGKLRNLFKNASQKEIATLISCANPGLHYGLYSNILSFFLSQLYSE